MENLEGSVASITFTVLRSALKPDTKIELVVSIFFHFSWSIQVDAYSGN